jgi:hypothetical protein
MKEGCRNGASVFEGALCGEPRGASLTGDPEFMLSNALEMDISFLRGPAFEENGRTLSHDL